MGHRVVGRYRVCMARWSVLHTRSPPASARGFYSSDMLTQTVASPTYRSPERKRWDTGSLGVTGSAWHVGRCFHLESPGFRQGLLVKRGGTLAGFQSTITPTCVERVCRCALARRSRRPG